VNVTTRSRKYAYVPPSSSDFERFVGDEFSSLLDILFVDDNGRSLSRTIE
ncbi:unnamed protein product, partial [Adineta steineri]